VAVTTEKGIAIICGLCTIEDNLDPTGKLSNGGAVIPPGIHTNVIQAHDSLVRIKELADIAIPLHDGTFGFKQTIPW
jgi:N-acyl homoserine lactone hydrolase